MNPPKSPISLTGAVEETSISNMSERELQDVAHRTFTLEGRRILVTGASKGLGKELAIGFAGFGAEVACVARSADGLRETVGSIEDAGGRAIFRAVDLRSPEAISATVTEIATEMGGLDVLVNNAADDHDSRIEETSLETWQRVNELNVQSVFLLCQAAGPYLMANGGGKIINISSILGAIGVRDNSAYVASKHAVLGFTRALALEWARKGVQVNALCPGFIRTDMTRHAHENEAVSKWIVSRTPMGRWGETADLVGAAVFLASRASDFVTGQTLLVDGGYAAQ